MNTHRMNRRLFTTGLLLAVILTLAGPASVARAASFVVTNLNDSGAGSLRQAIADANASAGADAITFSVSGTILLSSTLPAITDAGLTIDGEGQSITISGNNAVRVMEVAVGAALTVRNLTISGGTAAAGGGIYNWGTLTVNNSTFSGNKGGGIYGYYSTVTVTNSTFSGNAWGACIFNRVIATVTHSTFSGNAGYGIEIDNGGTVNVTDSTFSENKGGGINNSATLSVTNSTFSGNTASIDGGGGGITGGGTLTVANSTFLGNKGGGIGHGGTVIVTHSVFSGNTPNDAISGAGGSGISVWGVATVADSIFSANTSPDGGGISNYGTLTVTGSTFVGNTGFSGGGGIYNGNVATLIVTNSTFSGNSAPRGGGLFNDDGGINGYWGSVTINNATFSGNAGGGSGIFNGGRLTLNNTIVANSSAVNCLNIGSFIDGGGNLSWPDASCPGLNADPLLGPLQDNGGPTQTQALPAGSPAIDAALLANCPPTDQRGVSRPQGPGCDSGAFELGVEAIPPTITLTTPAEGAVYTLGQVVLASYACQDEAGGSGIAACVGTVPNGSPIDTGSVGAKTFTVNAADNAGNFVSLTHHYNVVYAFSGFFQPVDNLPTLNVVKAGVSIPVRFSLSGNQGLAIFAAGYPAAAKIACIGAPEDAIEETVTVGSSGLSYDAASNTYTYVWKTNSAWAGTCRQLNIRLKDGTEHKANFKFVR